MPSSRFSAVLLAAGQSSRMGRDKALLEVDERVLWERQRDVLVETGAYEVFLSARPDQEWAKKAKGFKAILHDGNPGCGPLTGIAAALERSTTAHLVVLAIDLPRMIPQWLEALLDERAPGVGGVGSHNNFYEPLAAVYPREFLPRIWESMAAAQYSLQPLLAKAEADGMMRTFEIGEVEAPWFENWNDIRG
jgi:molybdopterin-guanine dinucleotide biosynthesis protein A